MTSNERLIFVQWSYFPLEKKNVVVYKAFSCFNILSTPLYGDGENVWDCPGRGGCVGKTFQSEKWCLTFKGLITHIPLASNRITSHVGVVCVFREEKMVWFHDSCCHHCRWRNATLQEFTALMTLSCITYVFVNSPLYADAFEHVSTRKKIRSGGKCFLTFFQSAIFFFKIPSLYLKTQIPWYFSL